MMKLHLLLAQRNFLGKCEYGSNGVCVSVRIGVTRRKWSALKMYIHIIYRSSNSQ